MILVFGGAYQGKTEFVEKKFNVKSENMFNCTDKMGMCYDFPVINCLQEYINGAIQRGDNPIAYILNHLDDFKDKIVICDDICCGLVPLGKDVRLYRDNVGKILQILSRQADEVYRLFCGIGEQVK